MNDKSWKIRQICVMAMLSAMAFVAVATIRIPVVAFLKYEPKDVLLVIGGFLFGPLAGAISAIAVALLELVTVSDTGLIGMVMNILSSCLFVCIAAGIYRQKRTLKRAVLGLIIGTLSTTAAMLLWNYLITPLYMGMPREAVAELLLPVFLPFNLLKGSLNSTLAVLLYKGISQGLRSAHLLPPAKSDGNNRAAHGTWLIALFVLLTLVAVMLLWSGII